MNNSELVQRLHEQDACAIIPCHCRIVPFVDDSKSELLSRLQAELDAMRGRAETAKNLALTSRSQSQKDSLLEHAANIERAVTSLEVIIQDIRKAWE
jgi:molecular chaperone GrpE (heat shock protein)